MGDFIGNIGAFLLLLAAVMLVVIFLKEVKIIDNEKRYIKIFAFTVVLGSVYYFIIAFMKNTMAGQTNMFDFGKIFAFLEMDKIMSAFKNPGMGNSLSGLNMPLYPWIVNIIGRLVFEKYEGTAVFLNFIGTAVGFCAAYDAYKKERIDTIFYALIVPFAFLLFTPMGLGAVFGVVGLSHLAYYRGKRNVWFVLGIISVLLNKAGILFLLPLFVKIGKFPKISNPYIKSAVLYADIILCGFVMYLSIGGVK